MEALSNVLLALYYLVLGSLCLYGLHRLALLALYYRSRGWRGPAPGEPEVWPRVTVQLPVYNELYVAARLIDAVCALDYPRDRLEIQVLDDSTDETRGHIAERVAAHRSRGVRIRHLHRRDRAGFKAGALAAGLRQAEGELVAVFDADFVPRPGFLKETVPHFRDPEVGMVQARWEHLNRDYSLLTRVQAILLDGHFLVEHAARNGSGRFFNFNGTAGLWRRRAIEEAGGWHHDTLTEDLDLSYRVQLAGWRFLFLPEVAVPAELPVDVNAFKRQQFRWAKGSIQTARKLLGRVLRAPLPWTVKLESLIHLTSNACYPLMLLLSLLIIPAMLLRHGRPGLDSLYRLDLALFGTGILSVLVFYLASQWIGERDWRRQLRYLPALLGVGFGLSLNNSRAVLSGLAEDGGVFERTPKYSIHDSRDRWRRKRYRASRHPTFLLEGLMAAYFAFGLGVCWHMGIVALLPFLALFLHGYSYMFLLSLAGGVRWRARKLSPDVGGGD